MSVHDKMQQDYLWIRNYPFDDGGKRRNFGNHYLYDQSINVDERLEMIYRTIGNSFDWELEKYRCSRKHPDHGNKRRTTKNLFRFIKNPFGYMYWKSMRILGPSAGRLLTTLCLSNIMLVIFFYKVRSIQINETNRVLLHYGKNVYGTPGSAPRESLHDRKPYPVYSLMYSIGRIDFREDFITINPTWRQNLRKYLELTNRYNVEF